MVFSWEGFMSNKNFSEQDIRSKFITPAVIDSGWDLHTQIREEATFTADLFLELIIHLLKAGGRAAIVLPDCTLLG
jgi:type I restriction-modification system DNA methylase subunit